jgi:hypothetical protein
MLNMRKISSTTLLGVYAFLVGASAKVDLALMGRITLSEVLLLVGMPFFVLSIRKQSREFSQARILMLLTIYFLWFAGIFLSDILASVPVQDSLRGLMKPVFTILWLTFFLCIICRNGRVVMAFVIGSVFSAIQNYAYPVTIKYRGYSSEYQELAFGLSPVIVSATVFLSVYLYRRSVIASGGIFIMAALLLAIQGAPRSLSGILIIVGLALVLRKAQALQVASERASWSLSRYLKFGTASVILTLVIFQTYIFSATNGLMGEYQQRKVLNQSQTTLGATPLGLITAGRPQAFGALLAIIDSPIIGYGSKSALNMSTYYFEATRLVGLDENTAIADARIGHSTFLVTWLEHSFLAAIAMMLILYCTIKCVTRNMDFESELRPWILFSAVSFIWIFLFSPFGFDARMSIGLILALSLMQYPVVSSFAPSSLASRQ